MQAPTLQIQRRLFTVQEYEQMIRAGLFGEDDRLELIEGEVIAMSPISPGHAGRVNRLNKLFTRRVGERALISVQNPVRLVHSEPQPDLALLRPRADDYAEGHPQPEDVLLIVEVADTSADYDRTVRVPLYGRAGNSRDMAGRSERTKPGGLSRPHGVRLQREAHTRRK